ncbi:MAG TPA: MBL fold metallo-hydrolase [Terracidiphilus sp.]|nr:MBL fold metallo-hydrolase [Terracidiphilus sp.]
MCKKKDKGQPGGHTHDQNHAHPHADDGLYPNHHAHLHPQLPSGAKPTSRRDFFRVLMGGTLAGASVMELAYHRAAWARAAAVGSDARLFDLQKVADGVFFAHARVQAMINCNAAIFVRSNDVVVVDAHSKPSAATALLAQIKREVTTKPVRYVINTHFHWDHTQGNQAYAQTGQKVDFIATSATKHLMSELAEKRMKESVDSVSPEIEKLRKRVEQSSSAEEKAWCADQIRQMEAYLAEMKNYTLQLPTISFDKSHVLNDPAFDLQLDFHGQAHTAGDLFVSCPQRRALATGDASHCWLPNLGDGYPRAWPRTIDAVIKGDFKYVLGGHGPMQSDRTVMTSQRNYIEELTERVEAAKKAGQSLEEMKKRITIASLRSMQSNGYAEFLDRTLAAESPHWGAMPPLQESVSENVRDVLTNLDKA